MLSWTSNREEAMRQRLVVSSLTLLLALAGSNDAAAQRRRGLVDITPASDRHGFWISLGLGAGTESSRFEPDTEYTSGLTKPSFSLRMGGTVNPNLRLGVELAGWGDRRYDASIQENVTSYLGGLMLIGQFYPVRRSGFFLKGGAGLTRSGEVLESSNSDLHEDGFGWTAGAGYEIKLSRSLFITPSVDLLKHRSQTRGSNGNLLPPLHDRLAMVSVALTFQSGR